MARQFFRVELSWAKLLGVVLMLAPVPARLKEWAYAGFAINQLRRVQVTRRAAKIGARVGTVHERAVPVESASALIDQKIKELGDWRGKTLAKVREMIHEADPEIVEESKWMGTPVWSHDGIVCTGETYNKVVKMTFAKGAALKDPSGLFNSSLDGNVRRAIDIHEGDKVDEAALKDLIRAAVALNLKGKSKPKPRRRAV